MSEEGETFESVAKVPAMISDNELTAAVRAPAIIDAPPPTPEPPGKYCLDYEYNNQAIHETHKTLRGAVARVADLKRMGIVPAKSVAD